MGYRLGRESSGDVDYNSDKGYSGGVCDIAKVRGPSAVSYCSGQVSSDAVGHSLDKRSSSQYQTWSHPHICSEVASEDITYQIFTKSIYQNLRKSDTIMRVCFCAFIWVHGL